MIPILFLLIVIAFLVGQRSGIKEQRIFTDYWYGQSCFYFALLFDPDDDDGDTFEAKESSPEPLKPMAAEAGTRR